MLMLITYDVSTETKDGKRRLSKVAKYCVAHGQRVQNSVFECNLNYGEVLKLQNKLKEIIDPKTDSLRFYNLGNNYESKIEHIGIKPSIPLEGTIII
ncbi:MAG: CRISPR-associated endonuclease Cas2 [Clostridia bacterium]|nr:CRISPR-associated endonuclease Cas2 [Clostridia bacterium]MDD3862727.1 CRISPR-associated endonuclease Cas2 [Clostridia bacterium]